ncbi:MAG: hypothetical protein AB7P99_18275 [Vicinamibacterales bacterium]
MTLLLQDLVVTIVAAFAAGTVLRRVVQLFLPKRQKPQPLRFIRPSH